MTLYFMAESPPLPVAINNSQYYLKGTVNDPKKKKQPSVIWNGFLVAANFFYEMHAKVAALAIAGIALLIFFPAASPPFLGITVSILVTRLVVKILNNYTFVKSLEKKACEINSKYPKLQVIAFIAAVIICSVSRILGFVLGASLGILSGLLVGIDHCKNLQEAKKNEFEYSNLPSLKKLTAI